MSCFCAQLHATGFVDASFQTWQTHFIFVVVPLTLKVHAASSSEEVSITGRDAD